MYAPKPNEHFIFTQINMSVLSLHLFYVTVKSSIYHLTLNYSFRKIYLTISSTLKNTEDTNDLISEFLYILSIIRQINDRKLSSNYKCFLLIVIFTIITTTYYFFSFWINNLRGWNLKKSVLKKKLKKRKQLIWSRPQPRLGKISLKK